MKRHRGGWLPWNVTTYAHGDKHFLNDADARMVHTQVQQLAQKALELTPYPAALTSVGAPSTSASTSATANSHFTEHTHKVAFDPELELRPEDFPDREDRARLLPRGVHHTISLPAFNPEDGNSALLALFQLDCTVSPPSVAQQLLLQRLLSEPLFTELRTKQQLGYIVALGGTSHGEALDAVRSITVRILSADYDPEHMEDALVTFLSEQRRRLSALLSTGGGGDELVKSLASSIAQGILEPPSSYSEEASEFWGKV